MKSLAKKLLALTALATAPGFGPAALAQMIRPGGPDMTIEAGDKAETVRTLARTLREGYVYPDVGERVAKELLKRQASGAYASVTSAKAFADLLTHDMAEIAHDKHLAVMYHSQAIPAMPAGGPGHGGAPPGLARMFKKGNYGFEDVERLTGNIGYLKVNGFIGPEEGGDVVAAAMHFVANTRALIIDIRENHGGDPYMVVLLASYFFSGDPVHLNDLAYRIKGTKDYEVTQEWTQPHTAGPRYLNKPVYILTSSETFSAAEEFAYNLQSQKRATVVGETTGGGANPGDPLRLSAHFACFLPNGHAINPVTKTNWEGVGVKPDISTTRADAMKTALDTAIERLNAAPGATPSTAPVPQQTMPH